MSALPNGFLEGKGNFYEPFFGAGAVGIELVRREGLQFARRMRINDINPDLINLYRTLADSGDVSQRFLRQYRKYIRSHEKLNSCAIVEHGKNVSQCPRSSHFEDVRKLELEPDTPERAAWFLFLNRTCFNGLYRVNKSGGFNVPYGHLTKPKFFRDEELAAYGEIFRAVKSITLGDFTAATKRAKAGDFVYFDPPYFAASETASHTAYHKDGFGEKEQARLAQEIDRLIEAGSYVLVSNSDTPATEKLYATTKLRPNKVSVHRSISASSESRVEVLEYLGSSYPIPQFFQPELQP